MQTAVKTKRSAQDNDVNILIGQNLRVYRKMKGHSLSMLAEGIGLTYQQLQKYEAGKNRLKVDTLMDIAAFLNVDEAEFFAFLTDKDNTSAKNAVLMNDDTLELIHLYNKIDDGKIKKNMVSLIKRFINI